MNRLYFCVGALLLCAILTIPLVAVSPIDEPVSSIISDIPKISLSSEDNVKVYFTDNKKTVSMTKEEYLTGVLCGEIDGNYSYEAIKAQTVVSNTFLEYKKSQNKGEKYDITSSPETDQNYITKSERKKKCGDSFANEEATFKKAIKAVGNKTITYNSKPILAVYHAISGGKTESAKNVWGKDYPYLQSVESISDVLCEDYVTTVTYTTSEFKSLSKHIDITLKGDSEKYIGKITTSSSGTVLKCVLGGKTVTGQQIREAFNLRSADFDIQENDGKFVFTVRGFGHGVGMSQYGANFMAENGSTYKEIIDWYYTDCKISG